MANGFMPGTGPLGGPPSVPPQAGPQAGPMADDAFSALDDLTPQSPNPSEALERVGEALTLAHKLILTVLPQVSNINPTVAKDLHQISQRVLQVKVDIQKEMPVGPPPEMLMNMMTEGGMPPQASPMAGGM